MRRYSERNEGGREPVARAGTGRGGRVATLAVAALGVAGLLLPAGEASAKKQKTVVPLKFAKIYWEYNASANDLGVHVTLDGEDWKCLAIENPKGKRLFEVAGKGPYKELGMTELFFEGAEPSLDEFPLAELLKRFPEGVYEFEGATVGGDAIETDAVFSHAIPAGPAVYADVGSGNSLVIRWDDVTSPPPGFPARTITIAGYQVIVGTFLVTLPASANQVTVPPEYVSALGSGEHPFEVLAIEANANQTLTEGTFTLP